MFNAAWHWIAKHRLVVFQPLLLAEATEIGPTCSFPLTAVRLAGNVGSYDQRALRLALGRVVGVVTWRIR